MVGSRANPTPPPGRAARRAGVAVPTAVAAAVCGGSVLVIAMSGVLALDGGYSAGVEAAAPLPWRGGTATPSGTSSGHRLDPFTGDPGFGATSSGASPLPAKPTSPPGPAQALAPSAAPRTAPTTVPTSASSSLTAATPLDRGPLTAPRVIAAVAASQPAPSQAPTSAAATPAPPLAAAATSAPPTAEAPTTEAPTTEAPTAEAVDPAPGQGDRDNGGDAGASPHAWQPEPHERQRHEHHGPRRHAGWRHAGWRHAGCRDDEPQG